MDEIDQVEDLHVRRAMNCSANNTPGACRKSVRSRRQRESGIFQASPPQPKPDFRTGKIDCLFLHPIKSMSNV